MESIETSQFIARISTVSALPLPSTLVPTPATSRVSTEVLRVSVLFFAPPLTATALMESSTTMVLPLPVTVSVSASMPERSIVRPEAVISMLVAAPSKETAPPVPAITSVTTLESSSSVMSAVPAGSAARTAIELLFPAVSSTASPPLSTTRPPSVAPSILIAVVSQANM